MGALARTKARPGVTTAASSTYVTSPYLEPSQYPPSASTVLEQIHAMFGVTPTVFALYGYEAMRIVLETIGRSGQQAADRKTFASVFFSLGEQHGVLGNYRIDAAGDTTLDHFDGYRVGAGGVLTLARAIS